MSGLVKGVKKVFSKVTSFVKKYWKPIVAAVAVYFTAGVALSYFGSTAAFSASLPGFGAGGVFSKAAVWMGFSGGAGSGIAATAAAKAAGAAVGGVAGGTGTISVTGGAGPQVGAGAGSAAAATEASALAPVKASASVLSSGRTGLTAAQYAAMGGKTAAAGAGGGGAALAATDALTKSLNTMTKLSMVKMGIDTVSGLLAPDPYDEAKKMHALQYASSFGVDRKGNDAFGWGHSDSAQMWANMNKRQGYGSNVGYGQPSGQSQFRDTPFLPTPQESSTPRMPEGGNQQFIPTRGAT